MASTTNNEMSGGVRPDSAMAGILALLIDERTERTRNDKDAVRTEVLLAGAGLSIEEIAAVTGRKYDAVRMAIARGRAKKSKAEG